MDEQEVGAEGAAGTTATDADLERLFGGGGEVGAHMARLDWSQTPVGPPQQWPRSLRTVVRMVLTSRFAMWMAWGEELTFFCNDAYRRDTLAGKFPWALGRSAREVWQEIWPDIGPRVDHVLETGEATWDEALLLILERSGFPEETYHTFSYSPLSDDEGRIAGMLCVVSEDTDRVIGERRMATLRDLSSEPTVSDEAAFIRASARHLDDNRRSLPFTLLYLLDDADGKHAKLTATSGFDGLGHPAAPAELRVDELAPVWPIADVAAGRTVVVDDVDQRFADLPTGPWPLPPRQALAVPLVHERGESERPYGFLVVGVNRLRPLDDGYRAFVGLIAQRLAGGVASARSYEAERRRAEELAELDRAKTTFFSNISHELRTPLTLMLGALDDALADRDGLGEAELAMVRRNGLRLLRLVNALLEFSRIEAGRLRAAFQPVELATLTTELAGTFREATERAGLRLLIACEPLPEPVHVDPDLWERIVLNLLSNAFKFTLDGEIAVRLRAVDGHARLEVVDTGAGIPAEELEQLFQRFHRITTSEARSHEGSGIGLALVKELTELHGGRVSAESHVGAGSRFIVEIPFGSAHLPADQLVDQGRRDAGDGALFVQEALGWLPSDDEMRAALAGETSDHGPVASAAAPPLRTQPGDARVLIADDNPDLRAYLARLLSPHWEVETVGDGARALEIVRTRPPDLLVSDVMMPGMGGFELLAALRADPRTSELPVIMLSARAGEEAVIEGLEAGADDYLPKPFSGQDLLARVRANIELSRVRHAAAAELREERRRLELTLDQLVHNERLLALQRDVLALVARSAPLERTLEEIALGLEALLDGPSTRAAVLLRSEDGARLELAAAPGLSGADRAALDGMAIDALDRDGPPGCWSMPIRAADGELVGVFAFRHGDGHVPTDEERDLVVLFARTAAVAIERFRDTRARTRVLAELQSSLLPGELPAVPGMQVAVAFHPATRGLEVGGDFYDVFPLGDGAFGFVIGDVCGHGAAAAAVTALTRHTTRAVALLEPDPAKVLATVNDALLASDYDRFCTAVYGRLEPRGTGMRLTVACGGHPLPLVRRASGEIETAGQSGTLIGVVDDPELPNTTVDLAPGDVLLLHTDGLTERNPRIDGDEGLEAAFAATGARDAQPLLTDLQQAVLGQPPYQLRDDVAVLVLSVGEPQPVAGAPDPSPATQERTLLDEVHPADATSVPLIRTALRDAARRAGADDELLEALALASSEAATNVVLHAYADEAARRAGSVRTTLRRLDDTLEVLVSDDGAGMRPRDDSPGLGLGLPIISTVCDDVECRAVETGGTQVAMRFGLDGRG